MEKKSIEDLSNLVFGLALALGAITLVQPTSDDLGELIVILLRFALSFLVIVWIWWVYNSLTKRLKMERGEVFAFNIFLLFLVVIEPYLLTIIDKVAGATAYAIDLGTILMILAIFNEYLIRDTPKEDRNELRHRRSSRVSSLILASIFYASAILGYIPETRSLGVQYDVWLLALMFAILSRLRYRDHSSHNE